MTSERRDFDSYKECLEWTLQVKEKLRGIRAKIECPPLFEHIDNAIYVECHYEIQAHNDLYLHPTSMNTAKTKKIATKREHRKYNFKTFCNFFRDSCFETEICLYDDNMELDKKWMDLYARA
jgi:hypothetical protein